MAPNPLLAHGFYEVPPHNQTLLDEGQHVGSVDESNRLLGSADIGFWPATRLVVAVFVRFGLRSLSSWVSSRLHISHATSLKLCSSKQEQGVFIRVS